MHIYLVQRGAVKSKVAKNKISDSIDLDYMGSAEFEFGALPKSLRAIEAIGVDKHVKTSFVHKNEVFYAVGWCSPEELTTYTEKFTQALDGKIRLKEGIRRKNTDFWWDIQNHVFVTTDAMTAKRTPLWIANSLKFMNSIED
jgi:hypothetical protein